MSETRTEHARSLARSRLTEFAVGEKFLGVSEVCADANVSTATGVRALHMLADEGLITRRHGVGYFVAAHPTSSDESQADLVEDKLRAVESAVHELRATHDQLTVTEGSLWKRIAEALRRIDRGDSRRSVEALTEAIVHAGLRASHGFPEALGVAGPGAWHAGKRGRADSTRLHDGEPLAGVEVKITAQENWVSSYNCERGCTRQFEHLAHQGDLVIVTSSKRAKKDANEWPTEARIIMLSELADIMNRTTPLPDRLLIDEIFGL